MLGTAASSIRGGRPRRLPCLRGLRSCPPGRAVDLGVRERAPRSMVGRRGVDGECCRFFFCGNRTRTQRRGGPVDRLHRCRRAGLGAARPGGSGGHRLSCIYRSTSWLPSLPVQEVGSHRVDGCCISVMRSITSLTESGARRIRRSCPPSTTSPAPRADCRSTSWNIWSALSARVGPSMFFSMHSRGAPQLTVI